MADNSRGRRATDDLLNRLLSLELPSSDEKSVHDRTGRSGTIGRAKSRAEQRFDGLAELLDGLVWEADLRGDGLSYVSRPAENFLGYRQSDWSKPGFWANHVHPDDRNEMLEYARSCRDSGVDRYELKYRMISQDDRIVWVRDIISVRYENDKARWLRGVSFDITHQKNIEAAKFDAEERFREMFINAPIGLVLSDSSSDELIEVNPAYLEIIGRSAEEARTLGWQALTHPDDVAAEKLKLEALKTRTTSEYSLEKRYVRPDGSIIWAFLRAIPLSNGANPENRHQHLYTVEDITDRMLTESALRKSEMHLSHHLENTPLAVISLDKNLICTQWNKAAEQIFGYGAEEMLGRDISDMTIPDNQQHKVNHIFDLLLTQKGGTRNINDNITKDGRRITCEWYNTPILDEHGEAIGISSLCEDISEQERIRQEQLELTRELESRNAELERFVYTVSHDLRSPLVTIKGFVGLLQKDIESNDSKQVNHDLEKINRATDQMGELLAGLLELSKIGRIINEPESTSIRDLVDQAIENLHEKIAARGIELRLDDDMPHCWGDQLRLQEVFQNLIENAIKFMGDQPGPVIEVRASQQGDELVCEVSDNGIGIDPAYHERIFNLFERLDPGVDGTGIGMALVKRIIEAHGGKIRVDSHGNNDGSRFTITLPTAPASSGQ